jgi:uncharacterized membrane protein
MNKEEFLEALENRLTGLPWTDVKTSLDFYSEMIDDYIEDGMTEEEAVRAMGSVDEVTERILSDIPITKLVTASVKPKRSLAAWEIVLLILGAPIWLTVLFVIAGMIITVYAVIWAMVIAAYSVALALAASGIACVAAGVFQAASGNVLQAVLFIGAGLICAGLAIFGVMLSVLVTKGVIRLSRGIVRWVKSIFIRRGNDR